MKMLMIGLSMSLGIVASGAEATVKVDVDGKQYTLSALMENCKSLSGAPEAQIACYNALSQLLDQQAAEPEQEQVSVAQALEELQGIAQHQGRESGLSIVATGCNVQVTYFANFFHISRRNLSSIDLHSVEFDASDLQYDQIVQDAGGQLPLSKGVLSEGVTAKMWGGQALESKQHNFSPKSARTTLEAYANEIVSELPARESQDFEFVLVHPERNQDSDKIWSAFETFVTACGK